MAATPALTFASASDLVAQLAAKRVSSVELTEHVIARIEALDQRINAVVVRDFDRARAAAKAADVALARGDRTPLLGLPMTVKEAFNVAGLPTTWGLPGGRAFKPSEDALAVERLKRAGAVIVGKTNVPLNLADWQSYNDIYGATNNPWDVGRTPGGSSGGSAAALAAGFVALELGSDIGGSVRTPAHYCGVFAHKPSHGLLPQRGHSPPGAPALPSNPDLAVIGPLARSARDLVLALDVLAGADPLTEGVGYRTELPPPRRHTLSDFRVLVLDEHPLIATSASVKGAIDRLAERLGRSGARVQRGSPLVPDLAQAGRVYTRLLTAFFAAFAPIEQYQRIAEKAKALPAGDDSLEAHRMRGAALSHRDWLMADAARRQMQMQWHALFQTWDVVLAPVMPTPAFAHDHTPDQGARTIEIDGKSFPYLDQVMWPSVPTLVGLPATVVPLERSPEGLPIGVQIIGPYLEDRTSLRLAELLEMEHVGFVTPPGWAA